LDFNYGKPVFLLNSKMKVYEGCASISTPKGRLLFYTDGETVWDSLHQILTNGLGLLGDWNSTQSVIIIPKPGNPQIFYLFTIEGQGQKNGFMYSELDMTLNSGKGDIIPSEKNVQIASPVSEKITAVRHFNGKDCWVIIQKFDTLCSYLVTSSGINFHPAKSALPLPLSHTPGQLKISPDGKKIASVNYYADNFIADFNTATGLINNIWKFKATESYGVEFSHNSRYLYISGPNSSKQILQYDLKSDFLNEFLSSKKLISSGRNYGSLQLGPDNKIYAAVIDGKYLDVIHAPDSSGLKCLPEMDYVYLGGKISKLGLPNLIPSYFSIHATQLCALDNTFFTFSNDSYPYDSVKWDFGDISSGPGNYSTKLTNVSHIYMAAGKYKVVLYFYFNGKKNIADLEVNIRAALKPFIGRDTSICKGDSIEIGSSEDHSSYLWNNNLRTKSILINKAGIFSLTIADSVGCKSSDTIAINIHPLPLPNLGVDHIICEDNKELIVLDVGKFKTYLWYPTKDTTRYYTVTKEGDYYVIVEDDFGCKNSAGTKVKSNCNTLLFIPNGFSPNGDGINDFWTINGGDIDLEVKIANRWGEILYKQEGTNIKWDGIYKGEIVQDTYLIYWINIKAGTLSKERFIKGTLLLLK